MSVSIPREECERILDLWAADHSADQIAHETGRPRRAVWNVVARARERGDERAKQRQAPRSIAAARLEAALNMWVAGAPVDDILAAIEMKPHNLYEMISRARAAGDPRAVLGKHRGLFRIDEHRDAVLDFAVSGESPSAIARRLGIHVKSVTRIIERAEAAGDDRAITVAKRLHAKAPTPPAGVENSGMTEADRVIARLVPGDPVPEYTLFHASMVSSLDTFRRFMRDLSHEMRRTGCVLAQPSPGRWVMQQRMMEAAE